MELYGRKSKSIPQKLGIIVFQIGLLFLAYQILFGDAGALIFGWLGLEAPSGNYYRKWLSFIFSLVIFLRLNFMMLFLLKRKIPWEEAISVPVAFSIYYIGFALFTCDSPHPLSLFDLAGAGIFLAGSYLNTASEIQRHLWKQKPDHQGQLYTQGLFKYSMHINYFGDVLWVAGAAMITRSPWAMLIPLFLFFFFACYNIPKLDAYLAEKYKNQFLSYQRSTRKFVPFLY